MSEVNCFTLSRDGRMILKCMKTLCLAMDWIVLAQNRLQYCDFLNTNGVSGFLKAGN